MRHIIKVTEDTISPLARPEHDSPYIKYQHHSETSLLPCKRSVFKTLGTQFCKSKCAKVRKGKHSSVPFCTSAAIQQTEDYKSKPAMHAEVPPHYTIMTF